MSANKEMVLNVLRLVLKMLSTKSLHKSSTFNIYVYIGFYIKQPTMIYVS